MPDWVRLLVQWMGVAVLFITMYILVQWVTTSFVITGNGVIKWAEGFEEVKCYWLQCDTH